MNLLLYIAIPVLVLAISVLTVLFAVKMLPKDNDINDNY